MIVAESTRGRRLVAQLDRGAELIESVTALCRSRGVRSGVLSAFGTVEEVEVREFDAQHRAFHPPRRFTGSLTILHLGGHISERGGAPHLEAAGALAREGDNGVQIVGGRLVKARVFAAQIVIECFDDLLLRSTLDTAAGLTLWHEAIAEEPRRPAASAVAALPSTHYPAQVAVPTAASGADERAVAGARPAFAEPPPAPAVPAVRFEAAPSGHVVSRPGAPRPEPTGPVTSGSGASSGLTWAEVAAQSAAQGPVETALADNSDDDGEGPRTGDVIDHPRFGRCEVERIEGGGEYAQVRLRNRRLVRLSLDVIQLVRDGRSEEGRRRFRAQVAT